MFEQPFEIWYHAVDCYPQTGSAPFREFSAAAVGCWIRVDADSDSANTDAIVAENLEAAGWHIVRTLVRKKVRAETYARNGDGLPFYEQAKIDGFVAKFGLFARLSIGDSTLADERVVAALIALSGRADCNPVSLYSPHGAQWANGEVQGNDFVPLWMNREDARGWLSDWPGYELRDMASGNISSFVEQVNKKNMWIALGVGASVLTMCHPTWVGDVLAVRE